MTTEGEETKMVDKEEQVVQGFTAPITSDDIHEVTEVEGVVLVLMREHALYLTGAAALKLAEILRSADVVQMLMLSQVGEPE